MRKRNLALWPKAVAKQKAVMAGMQLPEKWVQEEEKLLNQRHEQETPQEMARRLVPGFDLMRLFL